MLHSGFPGNLGSRLLSRLGHCGGLDSLVVGRQQAHHVFAALSDRPIGIDAEERDRSINLALADKILSPAEKVRFALADDKQAALLRLWVQKEAAAKRTGVGLRGYPCHTDFSPEDPGILQIHGCYVAVSEEDDHVI